MKNEAYRLQSYKGMHMKQKAHQEQAGSTGCKIKNNAFR